MSRLSGARGILTSGLQGSHQDSLDFVANIDPSKLRIPVFGSLTSRPRTPLQVGDSFVEQRGIHREDVTLEIHKTEALPQASSLAPAVTFPGWIVQVCVVFFGLTIALSNSFQSAHTGAVCLLASPSGMVGIAAHAFASSASVTVAWGLFSSAWLLPFFCSQALWAGLYFNLSQFYLLWLSVWVFCSLRQQERWVGCLPFLALLLSIVASFLTHYTNRLDPRWTVTVSCFLCFSICVYATRNGFRYNYTIKPLL